MLEGFFKTKLVELGILPNADQELLLRAALLQGEIGVGEWEKWKKQVDINLIDHSSNRLLPLLYSNLICAGVQDDSLGRYKGVYRKNWYKNQLLMNELNSLISMFNDRGVDTMVLKGAALVLKNYSNYGLRPMADLDVAVPLHQIPVALDILKEEGWTSIAKLNYEHREHKAFPRQEVSPEYFGIRASCGFRNGEQREFDLHSFVVADVLDEELNSGFWNNAVEVELSNGVNTKMLSATDNLLHVLSHGLRRGTVVNLRWITDAFLLITQSEIEWERLWLLAERFSTKQQVSVALSYIKELLRLSLDSGEELLAKNGQLSTAEQQSFIKYCKRNNKAQNFGYSLNRLVSANESRSWISTVLIFPQHVKHQYLLKHTWQVPAFLVYKGLRFK